MKKLLIVAALLASCLPSYAQEKATAIRCNAAAIYDTAVVGSTTLVGIPYTGAIYVCGFMIGSAASATIRAQLSYSTAGVLTTNTTSRGFLVTGAAQVPITPAFTIASPTITANDSSSAYRGMYVPPGNQLNITTSVNTGTIQAIVYYFQQQQ